MAEKKKKSMDEVLEQNTQMMNLLAQSLLTISESQIKMNETMERLAQSQQKNSEASSEELQRVSEDEIRDIRAEMVTFQFFEVQYNGSKPEDQMPYWWKTEGKFLNKREAEEFGREKYGLDKYNIYWKVVQINGTTDKHTLAEMQKQNKVLEFK